MRFGCFSAKTKRTLVKPQVQQPGSSPGHLYIIKEREFMKTKEPILKLGKTTDIKHRMPKYPKDSLVLVIYYCTSIHDTEKYLIQHFDQEFKQRADIGREYYEGDEDDMVFRFVQLINLK